MLRSHHGKGIEDVEKAMEPMYTTKADKDRSGMGFTFMEAFMDDLKVESQVGEGTRVCMKKNHWSIGRRYGAYSCPDWACTPGR